MTHNCSHGHSHDDGHNHSDHHHHDHGHSHPSDLHQSDLHRRQLIWVLVLTVGYMLVQTFGGWLTGSLALLADSGHMLGDSVSTLIALSAVMINRMPAKDPYTFGYARFEILAALANGAILLVVALMIGQEAIQRFSHPHAIQGSTMFWFALGGLIVNIIGAKLLHGTHEHNLNMRAAYLHVLSDLLGSVSALLASGLILGFGWLWADAVTSLILSALILTSAFGLLKESVNILLEGTPKGLDIKQIHQTLMDYEGVHEVHELHVWQIDSNKILLTAHLVVDQGHFQPDLMTRVQQFLNQQFGITHATLQLDEVQMTEAGQHHCGHVHS